MNIFQMVCFVTLAHSSTFYEAAEKLYISQSSFSNNIQSVEKEFGTGLVVRGTRCFSFTEEGQAVLAHAEKIVEEYGRMTRLLSDYKNTADCRATIYADNLASYGYNDLLIQFGMQAPDFQIEIIEANNDVIIDKIKEDSNAVGVVFFEDKKPVPGFKRTNIMEDKVTAAVDEKHRLAAYSTLKMSQLKTEVLQIISQEQLIFLNNWIMQMFKKAGFTPDLSPYAMWFSTMIHTAKTMGLIAVIPENIAKIFCAPDMKIIELVDSEKFYLDVVVSEKCTLNAALQFFDFANNG